MNKYKKKINSILALLLVLSCENKVNSNVNRHNASTKIVENPIKTSAGGKSNLGDKVHDSQDSGTIGANEKQLIGDGSYVDAAESPKLETETHPDVAESPNLGPETHPDEEKKTEENPQKKIILSTEEIAEFEKAKKYFSVKSQYGDFWIIQDKETREKFLNLVNAKESINISNFIEFYKLVSKIFKSDTGIYFALKAPKIDQPELDKFFFGDEFAIKYLKANENMDDDKKKFITDVLWISYLNFSTNIENRAVFTNENEKLVLIKSANSNSNNLRTELLKKYFSKEIEYKNWVMQKTENQQYSNNASKLKFEKIKNLIEGEMINIGNFIQKEFPEYLSEKDIYFTEYFKNLFDKFYNHVEKDLEQFEIVKENLDNLLEKVDPIIKEIHELEKLNYEKIDDYKKNLVLLKQIESTFKLKSDNDYLANDTDSFQSDSKIFGDIYGKYPSLQKDKNESLIKKLDEYAKLGNLNDFIENNKKTINNRIKENFGEIKVNYEYEQKDKIVNFYKANKEKFENLKDKNDEYIENLFVSPVFKQKYIEKYIYREEYKFYNNLYLLSKKIDADIFSKLMKIREVYDLASQIERKSYIHIALGRKGYYKPLTLKWIGEEYSTTFILGENLDENYDLVNKFLFDYKEIKEQADVIKEKNLEYKNTKFAELRCEKGNLGIVYTAYLGFFQFRGLVTLQERLKEISLEMPEEKYKEEFDLQIKSFKESDAKKVEDKFNALTGSYFPRVNNITSNTMDKFSETQLLHIKTKAFVSFQIGGMVASYLEDMKRQHDLYFKPIHEEIEKIDESLREPIKNIIDEIIPELNNDSPIKNLKKILIELSIEGADINEAEAAELKEKNKKILARIKNENAKNDVKKQESYNEECSICSDSFEASYKPEITPCRHAFHHGCLNDWKRAKSNSENLVSCPVCRRNISGEETLDQESKERINKIVEFLSENLDFFPKKVNVINVHTLIAVIEKLIITNNEDYLDTIKKFSITQWRDNIFKNFFFIKAIQQ